MTYLIIGLLVVLIVITGILLARLSRPSAPPVDSLSLGSNLAQTLSPTFAMMQNQIHDLQNSLHERLHESTSAIHQTLSVERDRSLQSINRLNDQLLNLTEQQARLDETNRQVLSFSEQLRSLQDILKNPKQRGILGEYYLETILKNAMPPGGYEMQYSFANGLIADAVVIVKDKIIPIDSKFSLENYNRISIEQNPVERDRLEKMFVNDLKARIVETAKYIQPSAGTMDFAFMFIPHEAIYYDLLVNKIGVMQDEDTENLIQRAARKHHVIIVSPTSFLAYLQTVLQGLRSLQIEESAKEIAKQVTELGKHLKSFEEYHGKLGSALGTVVNHYNNSGKEFRKIDKDVIRITSERLTIGGDVPVLEKPEVEG